MPVAEQLVRGLRLQIADQLRDEILSGRLAEGDSIPEVETAKRFGTSRGPIREALMQLAHEGYVTAKPNCGVRVAPLSPGLIHDLVVPLRRMVETYALRLCFHRLREEDFRRWDRILDEMRCACLAHDFVGIAEQDIAFHRSIIELADQPDVKSIWSTLIVRLRRHFQETQIRYSDPLKIHEEHVAIVDVFRADDVEAAVRAISANIQ